MKENSKLKKESLLVGGGGGGVGGVGIWYLDFEHIPKQNGIEHE